MHAAHACDAPHALLETSDLHRSVELAAQDHHAVLAVDVQVALGDMPIAEQLAFDALAQGLVVGHLGRPGDEVYDAM